MNPTHNDDCFGCDPEKFLQEVEQPIATSGLSMVLMSLLSDVQEMVGAGRDEAARKALNRVKYLVHAKVADFAVVAAGAGETAPAIAALREARAATTPGTWHQLPGRAKSIAGELNLAGYTGFDVMSGHGRTVEEAKANVTFATRAHRAMPALLRCAELTEQARAHLEALPPAHRLTGFAEQAATALGELAEAGAGLPRPDR